MWKSKYSTSAGWTLAGFAEKGSQWVDLQSGAASESTGTMVLRDPAPGLWNQNILGKGLVTCGSHMLPWWCFRFLQFLDRSEECGVVTDTAQGFSNFNVHVKTWEILLKCGFGDNRPCVGPNTAFLTNFQVRKILLAHGPHFEEQGSWWHIKGRWKQKLPLVNSSWVFHLWIIW